MRGCVRLCFLCLLLALGHVAAAPLASWAVTATGTVSDGLKLLSGGDGVATFTERGGSRCVANGPSSAPFLYFQIADNRARAVDGPVYLIVEYFDEALGGVLSAHYDSATGDDLSARYRRNEAVAGGAALGSGTWKTAAVEMASPRFAHRQNSGADFRLFGMRLFIRKVVLTDARPAEWAAWSRSATSAAPALRIGAGSELTIGGFDATSEEAAGPQSRAFEANIPAMKRLGVTSREGYVRWNLCEVAPGKYDWSVYDQFVEVHKRNGLKWVPFLIAGPAYSLPDWYYDSAEKQGYVCLEHGKESDIESLWNPALRKHVSSFLKAFADRYRDSGVLESVLLGITGNYGEAIYPAGGNDWTADVHGEYHTHAGYWAGDKYAQADFRRRLERQYGSVDRLNAAWGTELAGFDAIRTFEPTAKEHSRRARLDLINWYIGSMNDWARFWMTEARKNFPDTELYLCTGGDAPPQHGSDFGEQAKIAAEVHGGVRITNEANGYAKNLSLTRWVASAGRQYGAYYGFEPAGAVDENGVVTRLYNATASGAKNLHYYFANIFENPKAGERFLRYGPEFQQREPIVEVAVYYPQTDIKLNGQHFLQPVQALRDILDFDYLSDNQIEDGGLGRVKALVMLQGTIAEAATWRRIADWVRAGGLLITTEGLGRLETVEGRESALTPLIRGAADAGRGRVVVYPGKPGPEYDAFLGRTLAAAPELTAKARAAVAADGKADGIFVTLCAPDTLLWLNTTDTAAKRGGVSIPARGIASGRVR